MMGNGGELDGVRIMNSETIAEGTRLQTEANDFSLGTRMRRSLGLVLEDNRMGASPTEGAGTFGHGGAGTSVGWADPAMGLAVAYITNGFRASATNNPRLAAISRAVRATCN